MLTVKTLDAVKVKNMEVGLPHRREGGWMFLAVCFDADKGATGFSLNFEPFIRQELPGKLLFTENMPLRLFLGEDEINGPGERLPGTLDDVCLYRGALGDDALARLKAYYMD